jgi:hypothetical protein
MTPMAERWRKAIQQLTANNTRRTRATQSGILHPVPRGRRERKQLETLTEQTKQLAALAQKATLATRGATQDGRRRSV